MIWGKTGAGEVGEMLQIFFIDYLSVALFLGWPHLCTLRLHAALWKRPKYEIRLLWKSKPSKKLPQLGNKRYCSSFPRQLFTKAAAERKPAAVSVNVSHLTPCSHTCCCYTTHCWTLNTLENPPSPPDSFLPTVSGGWMTNVTVYLSRVHLFVPPANVFLFGILANRSLICQIILATYLPRGGCTYLINCDLETVGFPGAIMHKLHLATGRHVWHQNMFPKTKITPETRRFPGAITRLRPRPPPTGNGRRTLQENLAKLFRL